MYSGIDATIRREAGLVGDDGDLRRQLKQLEADYFGLPPVVRRADLVEINELRVRLGLPVVDDRLQEEGADDPPATEPVAEPEPEVAPPECAEARGVYEAYLDRLEVLRVHRDYADRVAIATFGQGMTPVRPLATMGTNGGPLLCDHCRQPMILEGGCAHGKNADVAWRRRLCGEHSYILGGMVVETQTNGSLRIYHGYAGRESDCCNVASREEDRARAAFDTTERSARRPMMQAYIDDRFPEKSADERLVLLNHVLDTMFGYDPGLGVNQPS